MKYDSKEQIVGSTCNHTLCPAEEGKCPILDRHEKVDRAERILIAKDGKRIPILKTVVPVEIDGEDVLLEAFIDITERKEAEERLKNYSEELKQINDEMKNFTYIVSHDLRAPLVNIRGFSDELGRSIQEFTPLLEKYRERIDEGEKKRTEELLKKDIPEALGFIGSSVTRMDALINSILKLSRLGRNELKPELLRTEDVVHTLLKSLAHQIDMHKAEITIGPLPDLVVDKTAAEQIFGNLLDNSLKYLEPARPGKIEVTAEQNAGETTFTIRDNGRGIAKEDALKVFELFRRVGKSDVPGEGMGLTYVKTLVRRLGGRIWCDSELGVGTTFSFTIPAHAHTEK
jgi:signal transduction histidine kinase